MKQRGLTILSPIDKAQLKDLDVVLRKIGDDVAKQVLVPFGDLTLLHYVSWVVFTTDNPGPQLIFESNFDGPVHAFLRQLAERARSGLDLIYKHCENYPASGDSDAVCRYLLEHIVNTDTFYASCGGFTRDQVVQENRLHEKIEIFLAAGPSETDPAAIRRGIQDFVANDSELQWARQPAEPFPFGERLRIRDIVILVLLSVGIFGPALLLGWVAWFIWIGLLAIAAFILYLILRRKERTDPSISDQPVVDAQPDPAEVGQLAQRENRRPQNHLASVTLVKPGVFRFGLLKTVLAAVEFLGRLKYYKGSLGGIPSIHFARWAMINDGKYLLFLSNFDGSWEHYLGEFIDQAAGGLTAVWSNTVDFPESRNLVQGGAADEQRFKAYARNSQLYTQLWYSAYPFLSVANVLNNASIRAQLWGPLNASQLDAWLKRL
jgi:hypothetical protein